MEWTTVSQEIPVGIMWGFSNGETIIAVALDNMVMNLYTGEGAELSHYIFIDEPFTGPISH